MKNYASARANKGPVKSRQSGTMGRSKTAYRTPSLWVHRQRQKVDKIKAKNTNKNLTNFYDKN